MNIIENMKSMMANNAPILMRPGKVTKNVPKIILKFLALLTNLSTLNILNVLNIEVAVPTLFNTLLYSNITPKIVRRTTVKSKIFHPDVK